MAIAELQSLCVRYVYWYTPADQHSQYPLMDASPLFARLNDPSLFRQVYVRQAGRELIAIYELH